MATESEQRGTPSTTEDPKPSLPKYRPQFSADLPTPAEVFASTDPNEPPPIPKWTQSPSTQAYLESERLIAEKMKLLPLEEEEPEYRRGPIMTSWDMLAEQKSKLEREAQVQGEAQDWLKSQTEAGKYNPKTGRLTTVDPADVREGMEPTDVTFHTEEDAVEYYKMQKRVDRERRRAINANILAMREGRIPSAQLPELSPEHMMTRDDEPWSTRGQKKWYELLIEGYLPQAKMYAEGAALLDPDVDTKFEQRVKRAYKKDGLLGALTAGGKQMYQEMKDNLGAYWSPQTDDEMFYSAAVDGAMTVASFLVPPAAEATVPNLFSKIPNVYKAVAGAVKPANIARGGRLLHGGRILKQTVLDPMRGRQYLSVDEARQQLQRRGFNTSGQSDMDIVRTARGINAIEGQTDILRGSLDDPEIIQQMKLGVLEAIDMGTGGETDLAEHIDAYAEGATRMAFDNPALRKGVYRDLATLQQAESASQPRTWTGHLARGAATSVTILAPFMYSLRAMGLNQNVDFGNTLKHTVRALVSKKARKEINSSHPIAKAILATADDFTATAVGAYSGMLASGYEGWIKQSGRLYDAYVKEGMTPGAAILASYGAELASRGMEHMTEAGLIPAFSLSKAATMGMLRQIGAKWYNYQIGETLEETTNRLMKYTTDRLAGVPMEYRGQKELPFPFNYSDDALLEALGDFAIVGITAPFSSGVALASAASQVGPRAVLNRMMQEYRNGKMEPRAQAEKYAAAYYDKKPAQQRSPEGREEYIDVLTNILTHHMSGRSAPTTAKKLGINIAAFGHPSVLSEEAVRRAKEESEQRMMEEDTGYFFNKRYARQVIEETADERAEIMKDEVGPAEMPKKAPVMTAESIENDRNGVEVAPDLPEAVPTPSQAEIGAQEGSTEVPDVSDQELRELGYPASVIEKMTPRDKYEVSSANARYTEETVDSPPRVNTAARERIRNEVEEGAGPNPAQPGTLAADLEQVLGEVVEYDDFSQEAVPLEDVFTEEGEEETPFQRQLREEREAFEQAIAPQVEAKPAIDDRTTGSAKSAQVPMMITGAMRQKLADLGFTAKDISAMKPDEAHQRIAQGLRKGEDLENAAFHGGTGVFDEFSDEYIGKGEGAQAYGYGHYVSTDKNVATWYADKDFGRKKPRSRDRTRYSITGKDGVTKTFTGVDQLKAALGGGTVLGNRVSMASQLIDQRNHIETLRSSQQLMEGSFVVPEKDNRRVLLPKLYDDQGAATVFGRHIRDLLGKDWSEKQTREKVPVDRTQIRRKDGVLTFSGVPLSWAPGTSLMVAQVDLPIPAELEEQFVAEYAEALENDRNSTLAYMGEDTLTRSEMAKNDAHLLGTAERTLKAIENYDGQPLTIEREEVEKDDVKKRVYSVELFDGDSDPKILDLHKTVSEDVNELVLRILGREPAKDLALDLDQNAIDFAYGNGQENLSILESKLGKEGARDALMKLGYRGIRYIGVESGKVNFVVFDPKDIRIVNRLSYTGPRRPGADEMIPLTAEDRAALAKQYPELLSAPDDANIAKIGGPLKSMGIGKKGIMRAIERSGRGVVEDELVDTLLSWANSLPEKLLNSLHTAIISNPGGSFGSVGQLTPAKMERMGFTAEQAKAIEPLGLLLNMTLNTAAIAESPDPSYVLTETLIHEITHAIDLATAGTREHGIMKRILTEFRGTEAGQMIERELRRHPNYRNKSAAAIEKEMLAFLVANDFSMAMQGPSLRGGVRGAAERALEEARAAQKKEMGILAKLKAIWEKLVSMFTGGIPPVPAAHARAVVDAFHNIIAANEGMRPNRTVADRLAFEELRAAQDAPVKLTPEQRAALDSAHKMIGEKATMIAIRGAAGTGKTTAMRALVDELIDQGKMVLLGAPTNKAAKVLRRKTGREVTTVAKMLNLKPSYNKWGRLVFERPKKVDKEGDDPLDADVVIIDEASMIDYSNFAMLEKLVEQNDDVTIVFVGDHIQVDPVSQKKDKGRAFNEPTMYGDKVKIAATLETVMRQKEGNQILDLVTRLRENIKKAVYYRAGNDFMDYDTGPGFFDQERREGVVYMNSMDNFRAAILNAFKSKRYRDDPDYCRVVCYKNATVSKWNKTIRDHLMGPEGEVRPFMTAQQSPTGIPDRLINNVPIKEKGSEPVEASTEFTVVDAYEEEAEIEFAGKKYRFPVWRVKLEYEDGTGVRFINQSIITDSQSEGIKALQAIKNYALDNHRAWNLYEDTKAEYTVLPLDNRKNTFLQPAIGFRSQKKGLEEQRADINYAYAITTHKAQGSTFAGVFIDQGDFDPHRESYTGGNVPKAVQSTDEHINRLLYTAMTRPSKVLVMFDGGRPITQNGVQASVDQHMAMTDQAGPEEKVIPVDVEAPPPRDPVPEAPPEPEPLETRPPEDPPPPVNSNIKPKYRGLTFEEMGQFLAKYPALAEMMDLDEVRIVGQRAFRDSKGDFLSVVNAMMQAYRELGPNHSVEEGEDPLMAQFRALYKEVTGSDAPASGTYEVSSQGDARFSALNAKLRDGRTIEEAYQLDVKGYREGPNDRNWRKGKGRPPKRAMSKEQSYEEYKGLWRQWAQENPGLMEDLATQSAGKKLTDKFAKGEINQARALEELLDELGYRTTSPLREDETVVVGSHIPVTPVEETTVEEDIRDRRMVINSLADLDRVYNTTESTVTNEPSYADQSGVEMFEGIQHDGNHPYRSFSTWAQLQKIPINVQAFTPEQFTQLMASNNHLLIYSRLVENLSERNEKILDTLWSWVAKNAGKRFIPYATVLSGDGGKTYQDRVRINRTEHLDENGDRKSTWIRPPGLVTLGETQKFYEDNNLSPHPEIGDVVIVDRVKLFGRDFSFGRLAERNIDAGDQQTHRKIVEQMAQQGIILLGPGGKSKAFVGFTVHPQIIAQGQTDEGRAAWLNAYELFIARKAQQDPKGLESMRSELDAMAERMRNPEPLSPVDMYYALRAAMMEQLFTSAWINVKNSDYGAYKYFSLFSATDIPTMASMGKLAMTMLAEQVKRPVKGRAAEVQRQQLFDGLQEAPTDDPFVKSLVDQGNIVYDGGIVYNPTTGDISSIAAVVSHDIVRRGTPAGDGGAKIHSLVSAVYDMLSGHRQARVKRQKVRVFQSASSGGLNIPMLFKGMFFPTKKNMEEWMRKLQIGMILPRSVVKLGDNQIAEMFGLEELPTMHQLMRGARTGSRVGLAIGLVKLGNIVKIHDATTDTAKHSTSVALQTMAASSMNNITFPHLTEQYAEILRTIRKQSEQGIKAFNIVAQDPHLNGVLQRTRGHFRGEIDETPNASMAVLGKVSRIARDGLDAIHATPFFSLVSENSALHEMLSGIGDAQNGTKRTIGSGLYLAPDLGAIDQTVLVSYLEGRRAATPDLELLKKNFDVQEIRAEDDLHTDENLQAEIDQLRKRVEKLVTQGSTGDLNEQEAGRLKEQGDRLERLSTPEGRRNAMVQQLYQQGWNQLVYHGKTYYIKGTGLMNEYNDERPEAVNMIVSRDIADQYGWKPGERLLATALPSDAIHSTVPVVIVGVDSASQGEMIWPFDRVMLLGKDHDGDKIFVFGRSKGYWRKVKDRLKGKLMDATLTPEQRRELEDQIEMAEMFDQFNHLEMTDEMFKAMYDYFSDPKVQRYMKDLYQKVGIKDPFDAAADAFVADAGIFVPADPRPVMPLEPVSDEILNDKYQGAATDLIGSVAYIRNLIQYLVQNADRLEYILRPAQKVRVGDKDMRAIEAIDLMNSILTHHAVDVPAKENIFRYNYDMMDHLIWAVNLMIRNDRKQNPDAFRAVMKQIYGVEPRTMFKQNPDNPDSPLLTRWLDPVLTGRVFQKGEATVSQSHVLNFQSRKLPLNIRLEAGALANILSHKRGHRNGVMDALFSGFQNIANTGMSAEFYNTFIAPDVFRGMAQRMFGVSEVYDPGKAKAVPGVLAPGEDQTMFGLWRKAILQGDQAAWEAAQILHYMQEIGSLYTQYSAPKYPKKVLHGQIDEMFEFGETFLPKISKRIAQLLREHSEQYEGKPFTVEIGPNKTLNAARGEITLTTPEQGTVALEDVIETILDPQRILQQNAQLNTKQQAAYKQNFKNLIDGILKVGEKIDKNIPTFGNVVDRNVTAQVIGEMIGDLLDRAPNSIAAKMLQTAILSDKLYLVVPTKTEDGRRDIRIVYSRQTHLKNPFVRPHYAGTHISGTLPRTKIIAAKGENAMNTYALNWIRDDDVQNAFVQALATAPGLKSWFNIQTHRIAHTTELSTEGLADDAGRIQKHANALLKTQNQIQAKLPRMVEIIQANGEEARQVETMLGKVLGKINSLLKLAAKGAQQGHQWIDERILDELRQYSKIVSGTIPFAPQAAVITAKAVSALMNTSSRALSQISAKIEEVQDNQKVSWARRLRSKGLEGKHPGLQPKIRMALTDRLGPHIRAIVDTGITHSAHGPHKEGTATLGNRADNLLMHTFEVEPRGKDSVTVPLFDLLQGMMKNFRDFKDVAKSQFSNMTINRIHGLPTTKKEFNQFSQRLVDLYDINDNSRTGRMLARHYFESAVTMEMHTGELFPNIRLTHNGKAWSWMINGKKYTESQHISQDETFWRSLISPQVANRVGSKQVAVEILKTTMQMRHAIATNNMRIFEARRSMLEWRKDLVTDVKEMSELLGQIKQIKNLQKRVAQGEHYMPLFYSNTPARGLGLEPGRTSEEHFMDLYSATFVLSSPKIVAAFRTGQLGKDNVLMAHTLAYKTFIAAHQLNHPEAIARIEAQKTPEKQYLQAREEMKKALLNESELMLTGSEYNFAGFDQHTNTRMVDMPLLSKNRDLSELSLVTDPLNTYLDINLTENLEQMYQNHAEGLFQTYAKTLTAAYVDPQRAGAHHPQLRKALRSWDQWLNGVLHQRVFTKPIKPGQLVKNDDVNLHFPDEYRDMEDVPHEVVRRQPARFMGKRHRGGETLHVFAYQGENGITEALYNKRTNTLTIDGKAVPLRAIATWVDNSAVMNFMHRYAETHLPFGAFMYAKVGPAIEWAGNALNNLTGLRTLGWSLISAGTNSIVFLKNSFLWYYRNGWKSYRLFKTLYRDGGRNANDDIALKAMGTLPTFVWEHVAGKISEGSIVREKSWRGLMRTAMEAHIARLNAIEETPAEPMDAQKTLVWQTQRAFEKFSKNMYAHYPSSFWEYVTTKDGLVHMRDATYTSAYKLFSITEQFNRRMATLNALLTTNTFLTQNYDLGLKKLTGEVAPVHFQKLPDDVKNQALRWWVSYAKQQDDSINFDYSQFMRPRWYRQPWMQFMGKFMTYVFATYTHRARMYGDAFRFLINRDWKKTRTQNGRPASPFAKMYDKRVPIDVTQIRDEQFVKLRDTVLEAYAGKYTADELLEHVKKTLDREGILLHEAYFNPIIRAIYYTLWTGAEVTAASLIGQQLGFLTEPPAEMLASLIDLIFNTSGWDGDEDEEKNRYRNMSPWFRKARRDHVQTLLNDVLRNSAVPLGMVWSDFLSRLGIAIYEPLMGRKLVHDIDDTMRQLTQVRIVRDFMDLFMMTYGGYQLMQKETPKQNYRVKNVVARNAERLFDMFRWQYTRNRLLSIRDQFDSQMEPLSRAVGDRNTKLNAYKHTAAYNLEMLSDYRRGYIYDWETWHRQYTSNDGGASLDAMELLLERDRLGDPEAQKRLESKVDPMEIDRLRNEWAAQMRVISDQIYHIPPYDLEDLSIEVPYIFEPAEDPND
jgi:nucleoside-triphosphatase THEP1